MGGCCSRLRAFSHISMKRIGGPHPLRHVASDKMTAEGNGAGTGRDGTGPSPVRPEIVCVCLYVGHHSSPGAIVDTSTTDSKCTHLLLSIYWRVGPKAFLYRWSWFSFLPLTNDVVLSSPTYCTDSFMGLDCRTLLRIPIRQHVLLYICLHRRLALTLVYGIDWDRGCY
jgi:hypothetical protein